MSRLAATAALLAVAMVAAMAVTVAAADSGEVFRMRSPKQVEKVVNNVIRDQIRKERADGESAKDKPFSGFGPGSPLHELAMTEAKERGYLREREEKARLTRALLPQADQVVVAALPMAASGGIAYLAGPNGEEATSPEAAAEAAQSSELALSQQSIAAYQASIKLVDDVSLGAVASTGALPRDPTEWHALAQASVERRPELATSEVHWLLGTSQLEGNDTAGVSETDIIDDDQLASDLHDWFLEGGGKMSYITSNEDATQLHATEPLSDGETVLKIPVKLILSQISARHVKTRSGYLSHHMKDLFAQNQRWGLAMMLLHEHFKDSTGKGSKWGPFLRTLRVNAFNKKVMKELKGSYAAELYRKWNEDAEDLAKWADRQHFCLHHGICMRSADSIVPGSFTRSDIKWAMWVVRSYAINIFKKTTKKPFLALVPYVNMLKHKRGGGGNIALQFDNTVEISVGMHDEGEQIQLDLGVMSDAETFLKYQQVDEEDNDDNYIHLELPGGGGSRDDMFWQLDTLRRWRRELGLPPRLSDLWRVTESLHIFGDDEEEQKLLSGQNSAIANLPLSSNDATPEEQLMLLHGIDASQAALMVVGDESEEQHAQLYTVPDDEEDTRLGDAKEDLAKHVLQLQRSVATASVDNATQTVVNKTMNFLQHGVLPWKGLDEVDQLLLRKLSVLKQCGNATLHRLNAHNVSDALWCALRVHLVNQTDLEIVCPKAEGPWFEPKCEDDSFNASLPICKDNEAAVIAALRGTVEALLAGYDTSVEQDEDKLLGTTPEAGGNGMGPLARAAVLLRLREKQLLHNALAIISDHEANMDNATYQNDLRVLVLEQKAAEVLAQKERMERLQRELNTPKVVLELPVNLDGDEPVTFTLLEGENADDVLASFARQHVIGRAGQDTLRRIIFERAPQAPLLQLALPFVVPDGTRRVLTVAEGQNVTDEIDKFCMAYNITDESAAKVKARAEAQYEQRMKRTVLARVPVTGLDARKLLFEVRQGDQHDLYSTTLSFCGAYKMPDTVVENLANAINGRLPAPSAVIPVSLPNRRVQLRIAPADNYKEVVEAFCEVYDLPASNVPNLLREVHARLNPDAMVL